ncbi:hypothetical protein RJ639_016444 [Escallonia herrerae]|uniref:TF-B3 domain-containing protein n=1 Tax=Escallonia herrerae TaxID=1293975 RepID=A0AA88VAR6_9ASTE|nr:hypothetical protein RJ639_016444 [Escallonia herrerae]
MMQESKEKESSNNVVLDTRPYFFKIIADGLNSERLHISKHLSGSAVLRGPSGGSWNVKILKNGKATFVLEGWQVSVKDHSLGDSEFLLLSYDGNLRFSVQIFNKSGLERLSKFTPCTSQCSDGKRKPGRSRKHPVASLGPHQPVSHTYGSAHSVEFHEGNSLKKYRETGSDQLNMTSEEYLQQPDDFNFNRLKPTILKTRSIIKDLINVDHLDKISVVDNATVVAAIVLQRPSSGPSSSPNSIRATPPSCNSTMAMAPSRNPSRLTSPAPVVR